MNDIETFAVNGEYVKCDFTTGETTWYHKNGKREYFQNNCVHEMICDLISIILNHKVTSNEIVQFDDTSYFYVYEYNHKLYRVWWYTNKCEMYVQHVIDYEPIDDMIDKYTNDIYDILFAILNDIT